MCYAVTNRKGITYFLCEVETRRGPRYVFSREPRGSTLSEVPDGYEVRESVNGVVSIRKVRPSRLNPLEVELVRRAVGARDVPWEFRVDADGDRITIFEPRGAADAFVDFGFGARYVADDPSRCQYIPVMRFTLIDADKRIFEPERWCFRGSVDGWIYIFGLGRLPVLVRDLVPHLGEESFFELL